MRTVCEANRCTGCMACVDVCSQQAVSIRDELAYYNAEIDLERCIHCNACLKVCQNNSEICFHSQIAWYQGWARDERIRSKSSSGGIAAALAKSVVVQKGSVFSCVFSGGEFLFKCAENDEILKSFVGSKYVKSNPIGVYKKVKSKLKEKNKILFIGLPCQVTALKKFVGEDENLYTVDLICHGSPSPKLLDTFLNQYSIKLDALEDISFRVKDKFQLSKMAKTITPKSIRDRYTIAFLNGLIYTENCYYCKYARTERVADITIGDSWGSELSEAEQKKGVSLLLVQTEKGNELLQCAEIEIMDVDLQKAVNANHQLMHPSEEPKQRKMFFEGLNNNRSFNQLVKESYPKQCFMQDAKTILVKLGVGGGLIIESS